MIKVLYNPRCSKCREACSLLDEKKEKYELVEYLKESPSIEELTKIIKKLGITAEQLIRKDEKLYKSKFKGKVLSEKEWIKVLHKNPILIQRPVVINGNKAVIARPAGELLKVL